MKVVVAIDSLKGSLSSMEAGEAARNGILRACEAEVIVKPLADGGEGRLDEQTAMGKVPVGVAKLAKKYGKGVIAFAGSVTEGALKCHEAGIDALFPIVRGVTTLEQAMQKEEAYRNMMLTAEQVFRVLMMKQS